ncbi:MAG: twin-arginine translocation signal domain-containing protein [Verrucomicrobia subdivision 3 bacterium]|nr:twin-arginine translocation signal domain-containing protein [Limisphaerales bacterium]
MKTIMPLPEVATPNRRAFLKGLGMLGAGSVICSQPAVAASAKYAHRFQLFAEGTVTDFSLVWPTPQVPPLPAGTVLRVRVEFPIRGHDLLEWHTFLAPQNSPNQSLAVLTLFHMRLDRIGLSETPAPHFGLFGQIIDNPVVDNPNHSPFGDLTGRVAMGYAQFDAPGDNTTFTMLGGAAAGDHATAIRSATGSLHIDGTWQSF